MSLTISPKLLCQIGRALWHFVTIIACSVLLNSQIGLIKKLSWIIKFEKVDVKIEIFWGTLIVSDDFC